jgi:hypothetical protein
MTIRCNSLNSTDFSYNKNEGCKRTISIDVLDMGDMMSLLDYLWLVFRFLANGILQFNNYNLFSDYVNFDLEVF